MDRLDKCKICGGINLQQVKVIYRNKGTHEWAIECKDCETIHIDEGTHITLDFFPTSDVEQFTSFKYSVYDKD